MYHFIFFKLDKHFLDLLIENLSPVFTDQKLNQKGFFTLPESHIQPSTITLSLYQHFPAFKPSCPIPADHKICRNQLESSEQLLRPIFISQQGQMFITSSFPPSSIISVSGAVQVPIACSDLLASYSLCLAVTCWQILGQSSMCDGVGEG